jgi:hypothetical protein
MKYEDYLIWRMGAGVLATIGLYSVLYKENKLYRFFEHVVLGLASGWTLVALWTETLQASWWDKMIGTATQDGKVVNGNWAYILLLPIGLMGYFVFSKKHNWMSRIPIGIILGLYSGQQIQVWWNTYGPQIAASAKPIFPTTFTSLTVPSKEGLTPEQIAIINGNVYLSQAVTNFLFVFTVLSVLSYFLFSFDVKNKALKFSTTSGRYLLMIGFGAIFGSTVMMRFTLLIDRMYFVFDEFLKQGILKR